MSKELIYQYVKQFTAGRIASGFSHSHRVYHIARELGVDNYDEEILHAACYLHDTVIGYDSHTKSAEKAEQILREVGFPATKIDQVVEAIATHWPGETPKTTEAKLLHDANLLDSLGAIGVVRLSIGAFFWYQYKSLKEVIDLIKDYRNKSELLILSKSKEMAKVRVKFMDELIKEVDKEEHI